VPLDEPCDRLMVRGVEMDTVERGVLRQFTKIDQRDTR
jgi:hypothetical protein